MIANLLSLAMLLTAPAPAQKHETLLRLGVFGGRAFSASQPSPISGSGEWLAAAGLRASEKDTFIPMYAGEYRRSKQILPVATEGVFTEERLNNTVGLRWLHDGGSRWSTRSSVSYKKELTAGLEGKLGRGLFDFDKISAGVEVKRKGETVNLVAGLSSYRVAFPRYREAQVDGAFDYGDRILDFQAYDLSVGAEVPLPANVRLGATWSGSMRPYRQQAVVSEAGAPTSRRRVDFLQGVATKLGRKFSAQAPVRGQYDAGFSLGYSRLDSNQNAYDSSQVRFHSGYYDYDEFSGGPAVSFAAPQRFSASLGYEVSRRVYRSRPAQALDGSEKGGMHQTVQTLRWQASRPLGGGVEVKTYGDHIASGSNTRLESVYQYRYAVTTVFMGLSLSY